jgi:hypothetical protein
MSSRSGRLVRLSTGPSSAEDHLREGTAWLPDCATSSALDRAAYARGTRVQLDNHERRTHDRGKARRGARARQCRHPGAGVSGFGGKRDPSSGRSGEHGRRRRAPASAGSGGRARAAARSGTELRGGRRRAVLRARGRLLRQRRAGSLRRHPRHEVPRPRRYPARAGARARRRIDRRRPEARGRHPQGQRLRRNGGHAHPDGARRSERVVA